VQQRRQKVLGHVDFAGVGELQHGGGLIATSVLQDDDRMLARRLLKMKQNINLKRFLLGGPSPKEGVLNG